MSGAAIAGAAVIGAGASYASASKASKSSAAATAQAAKSAGLQYDASMNQLQFQIEQQQKWEGIFGPIQDNLKNYYEALSPDTLIASGFQNIEAQYAQSRQNLDTALAKRGITNSGATVAGLSQLEMAKMLGKAEVQTNAPMQVAQQKLGFLNAGLGQQSGLTQGISNAYSNQMNVLGQQSTNLLNQSNQYSQQAAQGYAGIGSSIGGGINTYMNAQSNIALQNSLNKPQILNTQTGGMGVYGLDYK